MNKLPLFAATTLLTLAFPALSVASVKCQSGTPEGEYACLAPDLKLVEGQVDRQLQQLAAKLRENARTKNTSAINRLNASQRIWRDYRSSFCAVEALSSTGNGPWLKVRTAECEMRLTKDRLESLRDIEAGLE